MYYIGQMFPLTALFVFPEWGLQHKTCYGHRFGNPHECISALREIFYVHEINVL